MNLTSSVYVRSMAAPCPDRSRKEDPGPRMCLPRSSKPVATAQSHVMPRRPLRRGRSRAVQGDQAQNLGRQRHASHLHGWIFGRRKATAPSRVLARTQITSPASSTPSMTSADNPENTVPTRSVTSIMTDRDTSPHQAPPKVRQSRIRHPKACGRFAVVAIFLPRRRAMASSPGAKSGCRLAVCAASHSTRRTRTGPASRYARGGRCGRCLGRWECARHRQVGVLGLVEGGLL